MKRLFWALFLCCLSVGHASLDTIKQQYGHLPVRLFFVWTSGIFGHGKDSVTLGGGLRDDFFHHLDRLLKNLDNVHVEILLDTPTYKGSHQQLSRLQKTYPRHVSLSFLHHKLADLELQAADHCLAKDHEREQEVETVQRALANAKDGNPALASDIARIVFLHHQDFPLNMYLDIDTFVENAKKNTLGSLFPPKKHPTSVIRMDNKPDLASNDVLAAYGLQPQYFDKAKKDFIRHQLMPNPYHKVWESYVEKGRALQQGVQGFPLYQRSIEALLKVLREDFEGPKKLCILHQNKHRGMTLPIAMLMTTGTASSKGARAFHKQIYKGHKPSSQSWGTFAWTSAKTLAKDTVLATLVHYLFDWSLFADSGKRGFLRAMADEILRLQKTHCRAKVCGIDLMNISQDSFDQNAYEKLKENLQAVKAYWASSV